MPTLPIPVFVSLLLVFLAARARFGRTTSGSFILLILACATQSLIVSLNLHYGVTALRLVQPVTASLIPPLAYLAFLSTALRPLSLGRDGWHVIAPILPILSMLFAPALLDFVVPSLFILYGLLILIVLSEGRDRLVQSRLESGNVPLKLWRIIALALLLSSVSDGFILLDQIYNEGNWSLAIIGGFSSLILLALGVLSLSHDLQSQPLIVEPSADVETLSDDEREGDSALIKRLDMLLADQKLYLDANLSLAQLARRLHVPAKSLSIAINVCSGGNVSRYINGYRIRHACGQLTKGDSITQAMLASGFNTKSNFNREFLRVMGCSPSAWLSQMGQ